MDAKILLTYYIPHIFEIKRKSMQDRIKEFLDSAIAGDKTAENKLFTNLYARLLSVTQHRICNFQKDRNENKKNAEDIVQETLETVYKNYKDLDFSSGFLQYVFGVLRNKIGDYFRKNERDKIMAIPLEADELADNEKQENNIDAFELREFILKSIVKLSFESQRIALALLEGYSAGGMIGILGKIPRGTLDSKLFRIRKELKNILRKGGYDE